MKRLILLGLKNVFPRKERFIPEKRMQAPQVKGKNQSTTRLQQTSPCSRQSVSKRLVKLSQQQMEKERENSSGERRDVFAV